jgi:hypothetical protein
VERRSRQGGGAPKSLKAAITRYIDDQRQPPKWPRKPAPPPLEYALSVLAKESWPYDHDEIAVRRLLNILSAAGEVQSQHDRYGPDAIRLGD